MFARLLLALLLALSSASAHAATLPARASEHLQDLRDAMSEVWPDAPVPAFLPAQIEQETCPSLASPKCWNPRTELKTHREYGFGLGQFTIAYKPDGSVRFNKWLELRMRYRDRLAAWTWDNRWDARLQMVAFISMVRSLYQQFSFITDAIQRVAFTLVGYNGGAGSAMQDRVLCRNTPGCDPNKWFDNVERQSLKSRVPMVGYGRSPYEISREYPRNVLIVRRNKYEQLFQGF